MPALTFNAQGYVFQDGLKRIRQSYVSAEEAVRSDLERAKDEAFGYQQHLEAGGEWIGERDEDGYTIWSQTQILDMAIDNAETSMSTLRKAYVLILYHHWERAALQSTGKSKLKHDDLAAAVIACGYPIHADLGTLRDLANALKHNTDRWGEKLLATHPFLLNITAKTENWPTDWYEAIVITDASMQHLFGVVVVSGPNDQMGKQKAPDQLPESNGLAT